MQSGLYVGISAQVALRKRMESLANNVANATTTGFRAEEVRFEALVAQAGDKDVSFASTGDTYLSRKSGGQVKTDNPLDVAVSGDAWLSFRGPNGPVYTRDGRMQINDNGALQTINGDPILDAGGAPIQVTPNGGRLAIARDGMISQDGRQVGAIGLFAIDDDAQLTRSGGSGVVPDKPARPVLDFTRNGVSQGFSEKSNVDPVMEMSRLIAIQRQFESMTSGMEASESTMGDAIKTLGATT